MTRNPFLNALAATIYIAVISTIMFYGSQIRGPVHSIVGPITAVSLFTLSAAVMGYLFCYQPAQLYFDGKKKQAVNLFLQTVGIFGAITALLLLLLFSGFLA